MAANREPGPIYNVSELSRDLKLPQAFFEHLSFGDEADVTLNEYELDGIEYFGFFQEHPDWHITLRGDVQDCLDRHGIQRVMTTRDWAHFNALRNAVNNNHQTAAANTNYEANTESSNAAPRKPLVPRPDGKYLTHEGHLKLPKFKKHSLYQKYPWLNQFRPLGYVPVHYYKYENEYLIPGQHAYHVYNNPENMWNWGANNDYGYDDYYFIFVPFGGGYGCLFTLTPNHLVGGDVTQDMMNDIYNCAAAGRPAMPFVQNVARGARATRRLGLLKSMPKKLPLNIFRAHIMPAVGSEHLPAPRRRRNRKTRKQRSN